MSLASVLILKLGDNPHPARNDWLKYIIIFIVLSLCMWLFYLKIYIEKKYTKILWNKLVF